MYYLIYEIRNNINGKTYIGSHRTTDINDDYMGSGKLIKRAIVKYGVENFSKKILYMCDNVEEMLLLETDIVNIDYVNREDTYNIKIGGHGGFDNFNSDSDLQRKKAKKSNIAQKILRDSDPEWAEKRDRRVSVGVKRAYKEGRKKVNMPDWTGRTHREETKQKISAAKRGKCGGPNNSQYNTMWIMNKNLKKCKKIHKTEPMPDGWVRGYKIKW